MSMDTAQKLPGIKAGPVVAAVCAVGAPVAEVYSVWRAADHSQALMREPHAMSGGVLDAELKAWLAVTVIAVSAWLVVYVLAFARVYRSSGYDNKSRTTWLVALAAVPVLACPLYWWSSRRAPTRQ